MRNTFRFVSKAGKEAVTVHNEVIGLADQLNEGVGYGQYMLLFDQNGTLLLAKQTEIVSFNTDVFEGELYATYKISVEARELTAAIASVGLSAYEEGEPINKCNVDVAPDSLEIYCTVYLEMNGAVQLVPGDNQFVRFLLGMTSATFEKMRGAYCNIPNASLIPDINLYSTVDTDIVKDERGMLWTLESGGVALNDYLCYVNGQPAFRYNRGIALAEHEVQSHYSIGGFIAPCVEVVEVTHPWGNAFGSFINITGLYETGRLLGLYSGYEFFCDPMFRYAGLCNGSNYYLIDAEKLCVYEGGAYSGKIIMCSDGEVACVDGGVIRLMGKGIEMQVPEGPTEVLYREDGYDIYVYAFGSVIRFRYEYQLDVMDEWNVGEGGTLSRLYDYGVIWTRGEEKNIFSYGGESTVFYPGLGVYRGEAVLDGTCYGDGYLRNVFTAEEVYCDKAKNRFFIRDGMLCYLGESGSVMLQPAFDFDDAVIAGNAVIFLYDGVLTFYRPSFDSVFVSIPCEGYVDCLVKQWYNTLYPSMLRLNYS
ncbi:MAG: hypothetical protein IKC48_00085 [Clostridia bacterium]|nr:hypothetical protein [Clostridia bacterium]